MCFHRSKVNSEICCSINTEIINTGTELMLGFVTNTNHRWLCRHLADLGFTVGRQVAVPDTAASIAAAVREALGRAELIICTGGLGPTSDDLTRECIAELLGKRLHEDPQVLADVQQFFKVRGRTAPDRTRVQAMVPHGAIVLKNRNGTAPGLALETPPGLGGPSAGPGLLIMLPGPPRELEPMFLNEVVPLLRSRFPPQSPCICRTLKSTGIGESVVEERIASRLRGLVAEGLEIGYCARVGEVDVRLVARGSRAETLVPEAERIVREELADQIFGSDSDELHEVIVRALAARGQSVAVAESCTGGFIANRLTNVPGASAVFAGGFVTYSNASKQSCLGVKEETLALHGAVSAPTAREMAEGAMARLNTTYALAATGIAGPAGGSPEKPVGTVFIALAGGGPTAVLHRVNQCDRETFKFVTSQQALELLRRRLRA
jgi:nicotinamide-nucleotide amidase